MLFAVLLYSLLFRLKNSIFVYFVTADEDISR